MNSWLSNYFSCYIHTSYLSCQNMPWIVLNGWLHDSAIVKRKLLSLLKDQSERKQDSLPFIVNMPSENDPKLSQIRHLLRELLTGQEDPEGFFCLCISILGDSETRMQFRELVSPVSYNYRQLHSQLITLYEEYFSKVKTMTVILVESSDVCTVEPGKGMLHHEKLCCSKSAKRVTLRFYARGKCEHPRFDGSFPCVLQHLCLLSEYLLACCTYTLVTSL